MRVTLVVPPALATVLQDLAAQQLEAAGVLLVRPVAYDGGLRLLARSFISVPAEHYELQAVDELVVRSDGYVPALKRAEDNGEVAIWVHTHPGDDSMPLPSRHDLKVDRELVRVVK